MMNYAWDFSQSETAKYFEWILVFRKEIATKEANCLRKNSETFGILEIALFNKISLSWQDKSKRVNVILSNKFVFSRRQWNLTEV